MALKIKATRKAGTYTAAGLLAGALILTGCSQKFTEPFRDAGRTGVVNDERVDLIENADGFTNASTKCDHGNRLYFAYHGDGAYAAIGVVGHDLSCPQPVSAR